jgi:MFS superfamily sulfate permease-like transporter
MTHDQLVDAFFTITGIAVVIVTILLAIGVIYLISIFRTIRRIVRTAEFATEMVKEDLVELRNNIKSRGFSLSALMNFFKNITKRRIFPKSKK